MVAPQPQRSGEGAQKSEKCCSQYGQVPCGGNSCALMEGISETWSPIGVTCLGKGLWLEGRGKVSGIERVPEQTLWLFNWMDQG